MLDRIDDTIVAVSSPPGYGAVGIVRLSGPLAVETVDRMAVLACGESLATMAGSTRAEGEVEPEAGLRLPAVFFVFRAPRSYTRQDLVEIHTIGSPACVEWVRRRLLEFGVLAALSGEFTARAFINGAMDLASAEAVAHIIRARTDTQLRAAHRMREARWTQDVCRARDEMVELAALVEADIDFSEEPIEFITPATLRERLAAINNRLSPLVKGAASTERLDVLPRILLLGPPNAGKSSLMNRLSRTRRAICAATSGTTRDLLSAPIDLPHGEAILLDAAGIDDAPCNDDLAERAQQMTLAESARVDLICLVVDLDTRDVDWIRPALDRIDTPTIVAANKSDLPPSDQLDDIVDRIGSLNVGSVCSVSARDGDGIDALRFTMADTLGTTEATTMGESVILSERQRQAITEARDAIHQATELSLSAHETIDCADVLAFELRGALHALGTVLGDVTGEDLLTRIFSEFCIGK